jgi:ADP-heptose:LPS heptosyltransferase
VNERAKPTLLTWRHRLLERALHLIGPAVATAPQGEIPRPRRLLVAKVSGLGDGVMVRSVMEHLRRLNPALEIGVLVCPPTREVLAGASDFAVHCYDPKRDNVFGLLRTLRGVRQKKYDVALDFEQYTVLTPLFIRFTGVPIRVGFSNPIEPSRARFLTHPLPLNRSYSVWRNFLALARCVEASLPPTLVNLPLPVTSDEIAWTEAWLGAHLHHRRGPLVAFHIGGAPRAAFKTWPLERFVALGECLRGAVAGLTIILTGTAADRPLIDHFERDFSGYVVDASGLGGLQRTAALLRRCDLLVSNDTGIMHLGAAMGTPTVGLFGATHADHWAPVGTRATYVRRTTVPCSPCSNVYDKMTPRACFNPQVSQCMWDITVDAVMGAARAVTIGGWLPPEVEQPPAIQQPPPSV